MLRSTGASSEQHGWSRTRLAGRFNEGMASQKRAAVRRLLLGALLLAGVLLLGVLPLVAVGAMFRSGASSDQREVLVQLPLNYHGWVVIRYLDPTCPPLERLGRYDLVTIAPSGRFCTSSERAPEGATRSRYAYVAPDGTRQALDGSPPIWGRALVARSDEGGSAVREAFFVGSESEYQATQGPPRS